jgi:protein gp37
MSKTGIAWTDEVWNPTIGCSKIGEGCANCYAEQMAVRLAAMGKSGYNDGILTAQGKWTGKVKCLEERLTLPLHWKKPRRIFVDSMSDLFHEDVPFEFISRVWAVMDEAAQHTYQILTKRIARAAEYFNGKKINNHIHLLASASTQEELSKAEEYLWQIPAVVRGVSLEPLLGPIHEVPPFEWYIVGCESGKNRRPCKNEWVESIVIQCKVFGVPVFVKQIERDGKALKLTEENRNEWPSWAVQEYPS